MMNTLELECPGCQKRLRLGEQLRGRAVRCPACQTVFAVRTAAAPESAERPPQSRSAPQRSVTKKTRPQTRRSGSPPLRERSRKTEPPEFDDPGDSEQAWGADAYEDVYGDDDPTYGSYGAATRGSSARTFIERIRTITVAIPDARSPRAGNGGFDVAFTVVRLNKPLTESEFEDGKDFGMTKDSREGRIVFHQGDKMLGWLDEYTLLSGRESDVVNALKGNRNTSVASEFHLAASSGQVAWALRNTYFGTGGTPTPALPPNAPQQVRTFGEIMESINATKAFAGSINLDNSGMDVKVDLQMHTPDRAAKLEQQVRRILNDGLNHLATESQIASSAAAIEFARRILDATSVSASGAHVTATTRVQKDDLNRLSTGPGRLLPF